MYRLVSALCVFLVVLGGCSHATKEELYATGMKKVKENNPGSAISFFKNALEMDQNYFDARLQLAKAYNAVGKLDSSEKELQKVSRQRPASKEVHIELAKVHVQMSKPDEALALIGDYVTDDCKEPDVLETAGLAYALKGDYNTSLGLLKRAVAADTARPSSELALAKVYLMSGNAKEAEALLTEMLEKAPSNNGALYLLAESHMKKNETDAAAKAYERILANNPADSEAFYRRGILYIRKRNYDAALSFADKFIERSPRKAEGHLLKGVALSRKNNFKEAIVALQKSASLQPSVPAYFFLGLCHYCTNELELSLSYLQKVPEGNSTFSQARELVSLILLRKNRVDEAIQEIKKVVDREDGDASAHNILGSAYMAKAMYAEGMGELNRALEIDPNLVDAHIKKGLFELNKGRAEKAESELNAAVRINPELMNTRLLLASYYIKRSDYRKAMQVLTQGIKKQKSDAVLYTMMADISLRQKKVNEAVEYLQKAKTADPAYDVPYFKLASVYYYQNEQEKGLRELESLQNIAPDNVKNLLAIASIHETKGEDGEAVKSLRHAMETGKAEGYLGMARYYLRKEDQAKALSALDEGIKKNPNEGSLHELKGNLLAAQKKYDDALKEFENLEKIDSRSGLSYIVNTYALMGKPEKALEKIRRESKKSPDRLDLTAEMSKILVRMGRRQDAIDTAEQIIRNKPESPVGYKALALIYKEGNELDKGIDVLKKASRIKDADLSVTLGDFHAMKKEYAAALERYREAEAIKPGYVPALFQTGTLLHALGRKNEAIAEYQQVLRLSQNNVGALNNLAFLYAEDNRDLPMALQLASRANMLAPNSGSVQDTLGFVLIKNEKFTEAEKILKRAVETMPGNASIRYHLALAYKGLKNNALAIEHAQKAVDSGDFPEAAEAKLLLSQLNGVKAQASK